MIFQEVFALGQWYLADVLWLRIRSPDKLLKKTTKKKKKKKTEKQIIFSTPEPKAQGELLWPAFVRRA